jgi:hypothetical protein
MIFKEKGRQLAPLFKQSMLDDSQKKFFILWSLNCFYNPLLSAKVMAASTAIQCMAL